ncbi:UNKNOWN [Stylonychia lemnae]|uniref:Major facilitator superfamily protein n=1 Tax=Stylonychia lemnae TaxID=5949 RepID=A0A078BAD2_STYLE|nr:UNKNOWN [Stylonychia lemnae]|eukprot:CDW91191.1 UNKNOWN [Stylonychia lemnae]
MNQVFKLFIFPLAIIACIGGGSIYTELNNIFLYQSKYSIDPKTMNWFYFAVTASNLFGIVPSRLYSAFGPKKTILIGGILLTIAHVTAALIIDANLSKNAATALLFTIGILGGQGACIIFLSSLGAMHKLHSTVCSCLINGILLAYLLGSDTFHAVLKYGVFPDLSYKQFLLVIAGFGALAYVACAILFQKKKQKEQGTKSITKGIALKKSVLLYALIQALYLTLVTLLSVTNQLDSYWGSRLLVFVLAINIFIPGIALLLMKNTSFKGMSPSETDRFLSQRGKNCNFKDARTKSEFWLFSISFGILAGVSIMVDENQSDISLNNVQRSQYNRKTYALFEVLGAFSSGLFLSFFRIYVSTYGLFMFNCFLLVVSQFLLFFIDLSSMALFVSVVIAGFVNGSSFMIAGQIAIEDYGAKHFSKMLGIFFTAAGVGMLLFDELMFSYMYYWFNLQDESQGRNYYGRWNKYIFLITILSSGLAFVMSIAAFAKTRKTDGNKDKISDFVNF